MHMNEDNALAMAHIKAPLIHTSQTQRLQGSNNAEYSNLLRAKFFIVYKLTVPVKLSSRDTLLWDAGSRQWLSGSHSAHNAQVKISCFGGLHKLCFPLRATWFTGSSSGDIFKQV